MSSGDARTLISSQPCRAAVLSLAELRSTRLSDLLAYAESARGGVLLSPSMEASWMSTTVLEAKHSLDITALGNAIASLPGRWDSCFAGVSLWRSKAGATSSLLRWSACGGAVCITEGQLALATAKPLRLGGIWLCNAMALRGPVAIVHREADERWTAWCVAEEVTALQLYDSWTLLRRDRIQL